MRLIFLLMLAANLAYLAWELNQPAAHRARAAHNDASVAKIVLLRELSDQGSGSSQPPAESSDARPAAASQAEKASEEKPDRAVEKAPETAAVAETAPPPEPPAQQSAAAEVRFACYTLGPFREIADLRKLIRDIREFVVEASFRSREEREQSMYWVYLPAEKTREAANALAARLKARKIRDYYVVNSGEQVNAISLGHFRERTGAESVAQKARRAGFAAQIDPVFKSYTIYWLDYRVQTDRTIPLRVLDLSRLTNISRFERSCE